MDEYERILLDRGTKKFDTGEMYGSGFFDTLTKSVLK